MTPAQLAELADDELRARLTARGYGDTDIATFIAWRDRDPDVNRALRDVLDRPARRGAAIHHQARRR